MVIPDSMIESIAAIVLREWMPVFKAAHASLTEEQRAELWRYVFAGVAGMMAGSIGSARSLIILDEVRKGQDEIMRSGGA